MIANCSSAFSSDGSFCRGRRHLLSHLVCFGRHTVTGLLRNQNRTQCDWTADYRLYSEDRFDQDKLFSQVRSEVEQLAAPDAPLIAAMDDSLLRKTGRRIYGSRYQRDPVSPPFHLNLARGLRVLQISAAVRQGSAGAARLIPIDFQHAALPAKPRKDAGPQVQAAYQVERAKRNINLLGRDRLVHLRQQMDQSGSAQRGLIVTIDGRFTNSTVLRNLPERTTLIGRVRKDSVFHFAPTVQPERGRKRKYGERAPTPEQLLHAEAQPWQTVQAYAAGKQYHFRIKTLGPVFSPMDKGAHPLRLVVVEPVPYRNSKKSKLERREPAFLICTHPELALAELLQIYLWRWDIEVNFRDEKTILGVGQAQVRTEASNQNAPALAVAAYALLLLAAVQVYGAQGRPETITNPQWYQRKPQQRATTNELINQLRYELWASALKGNFTRFCSHTSRDQSAEKSELPLNAAIFLSVK
ncbi:MAG TPA: transposase [Verrucomicrobiae bacterium]|nr:transposase [Verrucomicrobiae bacterium]